MLGLGTAVNRSGFVEGVSAAKLLNTYSGAVAAFSLRQLSNSYSGNCVLVRRASDDAELNIGFSGGALDTSALATHCGSSDGFVVTWYDQSGNSNNATQSTAASQPKIYDGSSVRHITENGKPAIQFDGSNDTLETSNFASLITNPSFYTAVVSFDDTADQYFIDSDSPGRSATGIISGNYSIRGLNGGTAETGQHLFSVSQLSSGGTMFVDGVQKLTNSSSTLTTHTNILISDNALYFDGEYHELILWDSDQSSNRTAIESEINTFYSIF